MKGGIIMEQQEKVTKLLEKTGMSVQDLAKAIGVTSGSLNLVAKGKSKLSSQGEAKLDKYIADNNITLE